MRALTSEFAAEILSVFIPAVAIAQRPLEVPMAAIEGGSYALPHVCPLWVKSGHEVNAEMMLTTGR